MIGPWYTLDEAREQLSLSSTSELRHLITSEQLAPVLYTKKRSFLLFNRNADRTWAGRATCSYRGHVYPLIKEHIATLLDNETLQMSTGSCALLEPEGILSWQSSYPFKKPLPHSPLSAWEPLERDELQLFKTHAIPLPVEGVPNRTQIKKALNFAQSVLEQHAQKNAVNAALTPPQLNEVSDSQLFFTESEPFEPDCLRIANSELLRYLDKETPTVERAPVTAPTGASGEGQRENRFHTLVLRILDEQPDISAKALEQTIKAEYESESPRYDLDNILTNVDSAGMTWRSRANKEIPFAWHSLGSLLSKLKKRRNAAVGD